MISTIYISYGTGQHHLYNIGDHDHLHLLVIMDYLSIVDDHSHHHRVFQMTMVITITGRRGLLCCVGGQLTNMQPIRTRKFDDSVVDDADGDDDDDDGGDDGDGDDDGDEDEDDDDDVNDIMYNILRAKQDPQVLFAPFQQVQ